MGIIKEPLDVDFTVDPRPLKEKEQKTISDYIQTEKSKNKAKEKREAQNPKKPLRRVI
jgi:hypothetical protein